MIPHLTGMIHLGPLPGSPRYRDDLKAVIDRAVTDARVLANAGFDALMVENFGDTPFFAEDVPKLTIAAMTRAVQSVADAVDLPLGVNVLRNDALGALAVAAATGAAFVRVNVLSGLMYTDQGPIVGRAAEVVRAREQITPEVAIFADVFVKHATPPPGSSVAQSTEDLVERGLADAVVVSGTSTGRQPDLSHIEDVRSAAGSVPVLVGSGATEAALDDLLAVAHGVIVGTSLKVGDATSAVDEMKAASFVSAAREALGQA